MTRAGWSMLVGGAVVALAVGLILLLRPSPPAPSTQAAHLAPEQSSYLPQIAVKDAKMSAAQNYLGQSIFYLNAKLTNTGSKSVHKVDLELEFHDVLDQVVLRDAAHPLRAGMPELKPGETRAFVIAFEHLPSEWNQAPPAMRPTYVEF